MNLILLEKILKIPGVSGFESRIRDFIQNEIQNKNLDKIYKDNIGNLIAIKRGIREDKIVLISHMDELGLVVSSIDENGLIGFKKIGGIDDRLLISRVVKIIGEEEILGVIGLIPPHLTVDTKVDSVIPWYNLKIDVGARNKEEVLKMGIKIGDSIVFDKEIHVKNDIVIGRGLDDRFGCFLLMELIDSYKDKLPLNTIVFVFSVEEEIGLRGASVIAPQFDPKLIIAVDSVSSTDLNDTPSVYKNSIILGDGPVIRKIDARMVVDEEIFNFIYNLSKENNIPIQIGVSGGSTDAAITEISFTGYKSIPLCFPVRYTHSTVEMVSLRDGLNLINLLDKIIDHEL
ncbi:MAG: M42 family metallopeptidase [Caldisericia bacterium]|jgi:putative aminopeptidase FrvX|nr:M42 family metallopeptidase [Caldisericia bacterium]